MYVILLLEQSPFYPFARIFFEQKQKENPVEKLFLFTEKKNRGEMLEP